jgi:hypothetical protein
VASHIAKIVLQIQNSSESLAKQIWFTIYAGFMQRADFADLQVSKRLWLQPYKQ